MPPNECIVWMIKLPFGVEAIVACCRCCSVDLRIDECPGFSGAAETA